MAFVRLLPYETEILAELMEDDGLVIMAKGLGIDRIIFKAIQPFCNSESLVFVLNTTEDEQVFIVEELSSLGVEHLPSVITGDTQSADREQLYLNGGVFFITSRVLVVDMLAKRVPIDYITGIFVHRAHKIGESSQEAFILRMFREGNCDGFVKGFSDTPAAFMTGFAQVERVMKLLFVSKLLVWPRFHANVNECLENHKPDVVELSVELTPLMSSIQSSTLDLILCCLRELKKAAPILDATWITLDNALVDNFDKMLRRELDPHWNTLNSKAKQLVSDVKVLRTVLHYLTQYDCVTFFDFLESLRLAQSSTNRDSIWMLLDASNTLFGNAKARVYGSEKRNKSSSKTNTNGTLEASPKWSALKQILDEVEGGDTDSGKVLVCASDERTCYQLRQILCEGADSLLNFLYEKSSLGRRDDVTNEKAEEQAKKRRLENDERGRVFAVDSIDERFSLNVLPHSLVVVHPLYGHADHYSLLRKLYELQPKYVILYDAKMEFVRQLEVFKASRPQSPLRVYFLFYDSSVEEQRYLTTLRKENDAFEILIKQKADMVIPEERSGKGSVARDLIRNRIEVGGVQNTRIAGGRAGDKKKNKTVVIDMREFRSDLPSLIHKGGMDIEPVTLEVGDYILSPDICVERKSISDLIGSLNNGRLYSQCVAMTRFYKHAILLIEFDENKSFSLQAQQSLKDEVSLQNISSKLTLLTIHFPKLRIIWSQSPHLTAEIFDELKTNAKEPNAQAAMKVGVDTEDASNYSQYNMVPQDLVLKFPGINTKNYRKVLRKYSCLKDLVNQSEEEIAKTLENADFAKRFSEFVRKDKEEIPVHFKRKK